LSSYRWVDNCYKFHNIRGSGSIISSLAMALRRDGLKTGRPALFAGFTLFPPR
jgi:hypothetical protein